MKKLLSTIETATNAELNKIIQALSKNKHIISIDITTDFEFIENIIESIEELFEEYSENKDNFNNFNRWLFSHSDQMSIDEWIELDYERLFDENFKLN